MERRDRRGTGKTARASWTPRIRRLLIYASIAAQGACVAPPRDTVEKAHGGGTRYLFSAGTVIEDEWQQMRFVGATQYRVEIFRERLAIAARGRKSSSGLLRYVTFDTGQCPEMEWRWAVTVLQPSADLRRREGDDVAASIPRRYRPCVTCGRTRGLPWKV